MSEHKDYVSRTVEAGNIHISEEVLASIAAAAALEVSGVCGLANHPGGADLLNRRGLTKGVRIQTEGESVNIDLAILIGYGHTIPEVGKAVQDSVRNSVESMTGLTVTAVNLNVGGIVFPPTGG